MLNVKSGSRYSIVTYFSVYYHLALSLIQQYQRMRITFTAQSMRDGKKTPYTGIDEEIAEIELNKKLKEKQDKNTKKWE